MNQNNINYFQLFQMSEEFDFSQENLIELEKKYRSLVAQFHPDKFASASTFEQKQAVMMSATINDGYRILINPLNRASYLLQKNQGIDAESPNHTQFETSFLMQQMEWRERLEEDKFERNFDDLIILKQEIIQEQNQLLNQLIQEFKLENWEKSGLLIRKGRFLEKILKEIQLVLPE